MEEARLIEQPNVSFDAGIQDKVFFNVAELTEKLLIHLPDILLVETDTYDCRNKIVFIKNEDKAFTLMNVPFHKLDIGNTNLLMVNKFTLVSAEAIRTYKCDMITLKDLFVGWHSKQVTLSRKYRKDFYMRYGK